MSLAAIAPLTSQEAMPSAMIELVTRRLVDAYQPARVYLFGSAARGDSGDDSDLDILIVVPDDAPTERRSGRLGHETLWGMAVAVDIVVRTSTAFDRRVRVPASLPETVLREGRLLHGA